MNVHTFNEHQEAKRLLSRKPIDPRSRDVQEFMCKPIWRRYSDTLQVSDSGRVRELDFEGIMAGLKGKDVTDQFEPRVRYAMMYRVFPLKKEKLNG